MFSHTFLPVNLGRNSWKIKAMEEENAISYDIRGAILDVYFKLGPGLLESAYHKALVHALNKKHLFVQSEVSINIEYDGIEIDTAFRADIIVNDKVIIELKSVESLKELHYMQVLTYVRLANKKLGILVNFNATRIVDDIHRIINDPEHENQ